MEFFVRLIQVLVKIVYFFVYNILALLPKPKQQIPPITNRLLCLPLVKLTILMQERQLTSEHLVSLYIERIKAVNPHINAIVQERFEEAMVQAKRADEFNAKCKNREQIFNLYRRFPMLGVPFTVKESCGLKGMSFVVGSLQRANEKATQNGQTVDLLCAAGGIPLLVSANPEFCFSIETNTFTHGKCVNPYNSRRTAGGSSGGEGALNGAGATLFGIGSDIAGSIRIPALFNGVFGHKPTAGVTSVVGHFPYCDDKDFRLMLQCGPITRFAQDLGLIMHVMAGDKAHKLDLLKEVNIKQVKIHYALGFTGLNGLMHPSVVYDLEFAIVKAVKYFQMLGLKTERAEIKSFQNSTEIALSAIVRLHSMPFLMNDEKAQKVTTNLKEYAKSFVGKSQYTKDGLIFELMRRTNAFMAEEKLEKYKLEVEKLKTEILQLLGDDGVLLFPTFHVPAIHHHSSHLPLWGIDYALIFNVLGLPCTNIPMGVDGKGLPLGFQVIAAPYQDRMCFQIAVQLENFFGGWTPPTPHAFKEVAKRNSIDRRTQGQGDDSS